jgi:hypothetical protein
MKSVRIKTIKKGVLGTPLFIFRVRFLSAKLPQGTQTVREVDLLEPSKHVVLHLEGYFSYKRFQTLGLLQPLLPDLRNHKHGD